MTAKSVFRKELWTPKLIGWYLYDFANSFVVISTTLYFSQWVVVDRGFSDFWFALPFIAATAILIFLSPYVGDLGDKRGTHYQIFFMMSVGALVSATLLVIFGRVLSGPVLGVVVALVFYGLYQFFVQLALVPYGAFIKHLAPADHYGKVSGIGLSFSEAGHIAGALLSLPVAYGYWQFFGQDRLAPLIPSVAAFFLFALPAFFLLRRAPLQFSPDIIRPRFWSTFWTSLKSSGNLPGVRPLLLAFYFFSDALISISLFSAIYLQNVFGLPDTAKVRIFVLVLIGFLVGSWFGGIISDRAGHRRTLMVSLFGAVITIVAIALLNDKSLLDLVFPIFGLVSGAVYASSRAYLAFLIPQEESGKFFGLYALAERFASIIGPAVWGLTVWAFSDIFPWNYRAAVLAMAALVLAGIIPLISRGQKEVSGS